MKNFKQSIPWIIILLLLMAIFLDDCGKKPKECPDQLVKTKTITTIDTINGMIRVGKNELVYIQVRDTIPMVVDTLAILQDFFSQRIYSNEYHLDSTLSLKLIDTVSKNMIVGRMIDYQHLKKTITITNTYRESPRNKVLLGMTLTGNDNSLGVYGNASFMTKTNTLIITGYDPFNKNFMMGVQKVVSFRKK